MKINGFKNGYKVQDKLFAGEHPTKETIGALKEAGITIFFDLTERSENLKNYLEFERGILGFSYPIRDVDVPRSIAFVDNMINEINEYMESGRSVYIHCRGGSGRTGVIVGCWLVSQRMSGVDALQMVGRLWSECPASKKWHSPNTIEQERYILDFAKKSATAKGRFAGCLVGLAVGDAIGTTVEFSRPGTFKPVKDMVGGGPFSLKAGQWTDDTSMALCMAQSFIELNCFIPRDHLNKYCRWLDHGYMSSTDECFDIGATTVSALRAFQRTDEPYSENTDPKSAGNGSLMRLAPAPMAYAFEQEYGLKMAGESSKTTHGAKECVDACRYYAGLIMGALNGETKTKILAPRYSPIGKWEKGVLTKNIERVANGSFKKKEPPQIKGTGYVVESMEAALWAFYKTDNFKDGCLMAVNLGDDADTTAAIYGQLAGAYYGLAGIPEKWVTKLHKTKMIQAMAASLYKIAIQ